MQDWRIDLCRYNGETHLDITVRERAEPLLRGMLTYCLASGLITSHTKPLKIVDRLGDFGYLNDLWYTTRLAVKSVTKDVGNLIYELSEMCETSVP